MFTIEVPVLRALMEMEGGAAETVKSWTINTTETVWERVAVAPAIETTYVPDDPLQERSEDEDGPTVKRDGFRLQLRPSLGVILKVRLTLPVRPFRLVTETTELPVASALTVKDSGAAAIAKSFTVNCKAMEWTNEPTDAVTVTV